METLNCSTELSKPIAVGMFRKVAVLDVQGDAVCLCIDDM